MREAVADLVVERRQTVERHRWEEMMLGVERHVPHQEPDRKAGKRRARVGEEVLVMAAQRMLGDEVRPHQRHRQD